MILGGERLDLAADGGRLLSPLRRGDQRHRGRPPKRRPTARLTSQSCKLLPITGAKARTSDRYDFRLIPSHPGVWPDLCCNPRQPREATRPAARLWGAAEPPAPRLGRPNSQVHAGAITRGRQAANARVGGRAAAGQNICGCPASTPVIPRSRPIGFRQGRPTPRLAKNQRVAARTCSARKRLEDLRELERLLQQAARLEVDIVELAGAFC